MKNWVEYSRKEENCKRKTASPPTLTKNFLYTKFLLLAYQRLNSTNDKNHHKKIDRKRSEKSKWERKILFHGNYLEQIMIREGEGRGQMKEYTRNVNWVFIIFEGVWFLIGNARFSSQNFFFFSRKWEFRTRWDFLNVWQTDAIKLFLHFPLIPYHFLIILSPSLVLFILSPSLALSARYEAKKTSLLLNRNFLNSQNYARVST